MGGASDGLYNFHLFCSSPGVDAPHDKGAIALVDFIYASRCFYGGERVGGIGDTDKRRAVIVVSRAASVHISASCKTVVDHRG